MSLVVSQEYFVSLSKNVYEIICVLDALCENLNHLIQQPITVKRKACAPLSAFRFFGFLFHVLLAPPRNTENLHIYSSVYS